jgi:hypothetical protein
MRKYPASDSVQVLLATLDTIRAGLTDGAARPVRTEDRLLGTASTYADLTCAVAMSFIQPHVDHPLPPEARPCWTEPSIAEAYPDLLAWRDALMTQLRAPPP